MIKSLIMVTPNIVAHLYGLKSNYYQVVARGSFVFSSHLELHSLDHREATNSKSYQYHKTCTLAQLMFTLQVTKRSRTNSGLKYSGGIYSSASPSWLCGVYAAMHTERANHEH